MCHAFYVPIRCKQYFCFRNLEEETNDAIDLFGDKEASGMVLLKSYKDYYYGYDENGKHQKGYEERIAELFALAYNTHNTEKEGNENE